MIQEAPGAGREVGLMYSFSSPSDDGISPADATDPGRDLTTDNTKHDGNVSTFSIRFSFERSEVTKTCMKAGLFLTSGIQTVIKIINSLFTFH